MQNKIQQPWNKLFSKIEELKKFSFRDATALLRIWIARITRFRRR